jgi:oxygen-dependent protoporphyrinogen oxidase
MPSIVAMARYDVIVVGGGISGLTFAWESARAGRATLVVEREQRVGGAVCTHRAPAGFWFELGAHTCYNSYAGLAEMVEACGLRGDVVRRAKTHLRFLDGDALVPGSNAGVLLRLLDKGELLRSLPRMVGAKKDGETVYSYYARIVGRKNYGRVLGPMMSAVPSQSADAFPADMLFKSRKLRRKDFPRSFTLNGGLQGLCEAVARQERVTVAAGRGAARMERDGDRYAVTLEDGERHDAPVVAIAVPPTRAAALLRGVAPELAGHVARVKDANIDTVGAVVAAELVASIPASTFLVPLDDAFHSVVTRDSVPDARWRAFAFHFKPGRTREERVRRVTEVLKVARGDLAELAERTTVLPSPVLGHEEVVREVDRLTAGGRLAITGNWFAGLSLEDCVSRSRSEWARVSAIA